MKEYELSRDIAKIVDYLSGSCSSIESALEFFDIDGDVSEVEDDLLYANLERCCSCSWWLECFELVNKDGEPDVCEGCRIQIKEDYIP